MSLPGDSENESSDDDRPIPAKRFRSDTCGASSTTDGSVLQDSDEELTSTANNDNGYSDVDNGTTIIRFNNYKERSPDDDVRGSGSSLSENCSSPNEHNDDCRPSFQNQELEWNSEQNSRVSFNHHDTYMSSSPTVHDSIGTAYPKMISNMMESMGWKAGKGLGKHGQGRLEPVEASTQKGKRGLGSKPSVVGKLPNDFKWTVDETIPEAKEEVSWMETSQTGPPSTDELEEWIKKGGKKLTIDVETEFVDPTILSGILNAKSSFENLDDEEFRNARLRSNPYETIGSVIFLNRAAVKMANMDAICDFMFTNPKTQTGEPVIAGHELLYFADVCAGPGGFSEYVLYKKRWKAKGFGFTLKASNDFKLAEFYAGRPETFNPYYGLHEDGDVYNPANLTSLKDYVLEQTDDKGVHFLMADGGFSVEGNENIQEILSKQLYLCQCLAALMLVRTGGHFVVKLFDIFTPFSVGLIYIMYRCFDEVCIHKPVTSRPANSERYLICKWKRLDTEATEQHLYSVNSFLWQEKDSNSDVIELVSLETIKEDRNFFDYIYNSNCILGKKQIGNLLKIAKFSKDKNLQDTSQAKMREQCLELWQLPDEMRTKPERLNPDEVYLKIQAANQIPSQWHKTPPNILNSASDLPKVFKNVNDWHFVFLQNDNNTKDMKLFLGCGGNQVYCLEGSKWVDAELNLCMPANTLVYAEVVKETHGQGSAQYFNKTLHIIDAIQLGGDDVSQFSLTDRYNECALFCKALSKVKDPRVIKLRRKQLFNMENFDHIMTTLEYRTMKNLPRRVLTITIPNRTSNSSEIFHVIGSVMFIKQIKEPWSSNISKKTGQKYYYVVGADKRPGPGYYEIQNDAILDSVISFSRRVMWPWQSPIAVYEGDTHPGLRRAELESYIQENRIR